MQTVVFLFNLNTLLLPIGIGAIIALVLGLIILLVARFFTVEIDEAEEALTALMPGANCGGCGYSGCAGYAAAIASNRETDLTKCTVGGAETVEALARYLGQEPGVFIPKIAHVFCQGTDKYTHRRYEYTGTNHCASAHGLFSGPNSCTYGCLGFGDCKEVCAYDAIYFEGGIAHINQDKCTACGQCVKACPKNIIQIIPKHVRTTTTKCSNQWPGAQTRKNCTIGCIGCTQCVKVCPVDAIQMDGRLAVIDQYTCIHCGACVQVCPTHAIRVGLDSPETQDVAASS